MTRLKHAAWVVLLLLAPVAGQTQDGADLIIHNARITTQANGGHSPTAVAVRDGKILAVGSDIYRTGSSRRHVFVLAAGLKPGDSGGALVDSDGNAIGTAFAIDPGRNNTSYALTDVEVKTILGAVRSEPVGTGSCLTD